jgi:hypothetical protein
MLHATVKSHRASYRSLAEGSIPSVLPAIGLRLAAYLEGYAPWVWWRVCKLLRLALPRNSEGNRARQQLPNKIVRIGETTA